MKPSDDVRIPRWVISTWHLAAVMTAVLLALIAFVTYQNQQQLQQLNQFLVRAQVRQDSLRAAQRPLLDSLLRRRQQP